MMNDLMNGAWFDAAMVCGAVFVVFIAMMIGSKE